MGKLKKMRKVAINSKMELEINKGIIAAKYQKAMIEEFNNRFEALEEEGVEGIRQGFLETGDQARYLTPEEYSQLAVDTYLTVKKQRDGKA
jgi:hypothetical protein